MTGGAFTIRMITIDCHDPAARAAFWSAATDCPVVADYEDFAMVAPPNDLGPAS